MDSKLNQEMPSDVLHPELHQAVLAWFVELMGGKEELSPRTFGARYALPAEFIDDMAAALQGLAKDRDPDLDLNVKRAIVGAISFGAWMAETTKDRVS